MPVFAIPETKENEILQACPSLYSIIQFLLTLTSCAVLTTCISTTLWVETFLVSGESQYRYLSVGLWRVCYYTNMSHPSTATECNTVKFNDFTISVQICQSIAVISACTTVILSLTAAFTKCCTRCVNYNSAISYNARKYRIVCYIVTILGICVSVPLYMCEANIEGVQLSSGIHSVVKHMNKEHNSKSQVTTSALGDLTTTPPTNHTLTSTDSSKVTHYSVFALALWMQFVVLVLTAIAFTMAMVKHVKKRKELYGQPRGNSRKARPSLTIEMKTRPRSESQRAFFSRQSSSNSMIAPSQDVPMSP